MTGFTIKHDEELERDYGNGCSCGARWAWLVRHQRGGASAGGVDPRARRDRAGPRGAVLRAGRQPDARRRRLRPPAPARVVRPARPRALRTVRNDGDAVARVLIVSAPVRAATSRSTGPERPAFKASRSRPRWSRRTGRARRPGDSRTPPGSGGRGPRRASARSRRASRRAVAHRAHAPDPLRSSAEVIITASAPTRIALTASSWCGRRRSRRG